MFQSEARCVQAARLRAFLAARGKLCTRAAHQATLALSKDEMRQAGCEFLRPSAGEWSTAWQALRSAASAKGRQKEAERVARQDATRSREVVGLLQRGGADSIPAATCTQEELQMRDLDERLKVRALAKHVVEQTLMLLLWHLSQSFGSFFVA